MSTWTSWTTFTPRRERSSTFRRGLSSPRALKSQVFKCGLNFSLDELNAGAGGKGLIVYAVTVEYEDIFMRKREMGACRVWSGGAGFSVDGDKRVNFGD